MNIPPKLSTSSSSLAAPSTAATVAEGAAPAVEGALPPISAQTTLPPPASNESNTLGYDTRKSVARKLSTTYDTISILAMKQSDIQRFHVSKSTAIRTTKVTKPAKSRRKARVFCKCGSEGVCVVVQAVSYMEEERSLSYMEEGKSLFYMEKEVFVYGERSLSYMENDVCPIWAKKFVVYGERSLSYMEWKGRGKEGMCSEKASRGRRKPRDVKGRPQLPSVTAVDARKKNEKMTLAKQQKHQQKPQVDEKKKT